MKGKRLLAFAAVLVLLVCCFAGCKKEEEKEEPDLTTVNLNDYLVVQFDGFNEDGTATAFVDTSAMKKDVEKKIELDEDYKKKWRKEGLLSQKSMTEILVEKCVTVSLDKSSNISNGDTLKITWKCKDQMAQDVFCIELDYSDEEKKVDGLKPIGKFDPFSHMNVTFSGLSGDGTFDIAQDSSAEWNDLTIDCDSDDDYLYNGDVITITVDYNSSEEDFKKKYSEVVETKSKTFTASGLSEYIANSTDLPNDVFLQMDTTLRDCFKETNITATGEALDSMEFVCNYVLSNSENYDGNFVFFVYRVTVHNPEESVTLYWVGLFRNVVKIPGGTVEYDDDEYMAYCDWVYMENSSYRYEGYVTLNEANESINMFADSYGYIIQG